MRAGPLRHSIVIEQFTPTRGTSGSVKEAWEPWARVYAAVEPLSGREVVNLRAAQIQATTRFRIRYADGVSPRMRIVWRGDVYSIDEVINVDAADREIEILATAEVV